LLLNKRLWNDSAAAVGPDNLIEICDVSEIFHKFNLFSSLVKCYQVHEYEKGLYYDNNNFMELSVSLGLKSDTTAKRHGLA